MRSRGDLKRCHYKLAGDIEDIILIAWADGLFQARFPYCLINIPNSCER